MASERTPQPHFRLIIRQPEAVSKGAKEIVLNDGLFLIGEEGEVLSELSSFLYRWEIIREVGRPSRVRLELYGGEIVCETNTAGQ